MTDYRQSQDIQRAGAIAVHPVFSEKEMMARGSVRRVLIQFHREWITLRECESGGAWVSTANVLFDRYSHEIYDIVCDTEAIIGGDLAVEIRCLSVDMIKTANILIMTECEEECRKRGDIFAKKALLHAERCLTRVMDRRLLHG